MTLSFFTPEQGYQKPLIENSKTAPSKTAPSKKAFTTKTDDTQNREVFKTQRAEKGPQPTTHNPVKEEQDFYALMKTLIEGTEVQTEETKTVEKPAISGAADVPAENVDTSEFYTQQDALSAALNAVEPQLGTDNIQGENTQIDFATITALKTEIQRLIDEQKTATDDTDTSTQIVTDSETISENVENIFSLLSSLFLLDDKDSTENKNEDGKLDTEFDILLDKIHKVVDAEDPAAITVNFTPAELVQIKDLIEKHISRILEEAEQEAVQALAAQWVSLIAPDEENSEPEKYPPLASSVLDHEAPKALGSSEKHHSQERYDARFDAGRYSTPDNIAKPDAQAPKTSDGKPSLDAKAPVTPAQVTSSTAQSAGQQFLDLTGLNQSGTQTPAITGDIVTTAATQSTAQTTVQSGLTNVITQSQGATHAHPATQLVSATIQKAMKAGEDTNIKLRLDPPELGRVEVKMSIDGDNATRVVLTAEKPETYMMLKQDSNLLQQALADAGLDTGGDLSFELADEDHEFHQQHSGKHTGDAPDEDIIETTMDWSVDPETGRMRYDVLV